VWFCGWSSGRGRVGAGRAVSRAPEASWGPGPIRLRGLPFVRGPRRWGGGGIRSADVRSTAQSLRGCPPHPAPAPLDAASMRAVGGGAVLGGLAVCGVSAVYVAASDRAVTDRSATGPRLTWVNRSGRRRVPSGRGPACPSTASRRSTTTTSSSARSVPRCVRFVDRAIPPNVPQCLVPLMRSPAFDPGREYTVPWQPGSPVSRATAGNWAARSGICRISGRAT
jgi:hypothetical protein